MILKICGTKVHTIHPSLLLPKLLASFTIWLAHSIFVPLFVTIISPIYVTIFVPIFVTIFVPLFDPIFVLIWWAHYIFVPATATALEYQQGFFFEIISSRPLLSFTLYNWNILDPHICHFICFWYAFIIFHLKCSLGQFVCKLCPLFYCPVFN